MTQFNYTRLELFGVQEDHRTAPVIPLMRPSGHDHAHIGPPGPVFLSSQ